MGAGQLRVLAGSGSAQDELGNVLGAVESAWYAFLEIDDNAPPKV